MDLSLNLLSALLFIKNKLIQGLFIVLMLFGIIITKMYENVRKRMGGIWQHIKAYAHVCKRVKTYQTDKRG